MLQPSIHWVRLVVSASPILSKGALVHVGFVAWLGLGLHIVRVSGLCALKQA